MDEGETADMTLLALSNRSGFSVTNAMIAVKRDIVDSGSNCNSRKKRIAPSMRSRPSVFTVGILCSANHIMAELTEASVTAPRAPPNQ